MMRPAAFAVIAVIVERAAAYRDSVIVVETRPKNHMSIRMAALK